MIFFFNSAPTLADVLRKPGAVEPDSGFTLDADKDLIRHAIGKAFSGTEEGGGEQFLRWACSHIHFDSQEEREQFVRFIVSYEYLEDLKCDRFQIASQLHDSTIVSVASVQMYNPDEHAALQKSVFRKIRKQWKLLSTIFKIVAVLKEEVPKVLQDKERKEDVERLEEKTCKWEEEVTNWHIRYGPKRPHWYVQFVACNPEFQGQGKGKELMNKLCEMADQMGQDMYLEAAEPKFYEKFGFVIKHTELFSDAQDPVAKPFPMHFLTREAKPCS